MRRLSWKLCLITSFCSLALLGNAAPVLAAADDPAGTDARLQLLEQRINEIAQRQQQGMRGLNAAPGARGPMGRGFGAQIQGQPPMPQPAPANIAPSVPAAVPHPLLEARLHKLGNLVRLILLVCVLCNILLAVWIYTDIRKRGEGSGIFIALALVAGVPAAIIYSLVRIGDKASAPPK
ncbi:MAG: hypothetical protein ABSA47_14060 [Verrucomicrobiota bacterium]|jgi:hypothetical protein